MSIELLRNTAKVRAPKQVLSSDEGEICLAVTTSAVRRVIPEWLKGRYAEFTAVDTEIDMIFGDSSVTCSFGTDSSVDGSGNIDVQTGTGRRIKSGQTRSWIVPRECTHMSIDAEGTGKLYIGVASYDVVK